MGFLESTIFYTGMVLSTVWKTVINFSSLWNTGKYGTIAVAILISISFLFLGIKLTSFIENMHPAVKILVGLIILGLLSYGAYNYTGGESIGFNGENVSAMPEIIQNQEIPIIDLTGVTNETN